MNRRANAARATAGQTPARATAGRASWVVSVLVAGITAALLLPASARTKRVVPRYERSFDHETHAKLVDGKLGKTLSCDGECHAMSGDYTVWKTKFDDKKEHARCYKACHGGFRHEMTKSKRKLRGIVGRTCYVCHQARLKYRPSSNNLGQVAGKKENTYVATYSHSKHVMGAKSGTGKQCEACHGKFGDAQPKRKGALSAGHDYCGSCHGRAAEPTMQKCDGCHIPKSSDEGKQPVVKPRPSNVYSTKGAFDHSAHAQIRRVGKQGRTCFRCHDNIGDTKDDKVVPMPAMKTCQKDCHDGKNAFSVIGTTCTKCHRGGL